MAAIFLLAATAAVQSAPQSEEEMDLSKARAHWISRDTILWDVKPSPGDRTWLRDLSAGDVAAVELVARQADLPSGLTSRFPHLNGYSVFTIPAEHQETARSMLKGRLGVSLTSADGEPRAASSVQIPGVLDDLYAYEGELGAVFRSGVPTLKVWAPTARSVAVLLYEDSQAETQPLRRPMTEDLRTGVWSVIGELDWNRKYYLYEVEVFSPASGRIVRNLTTDPYSLSLSADGKRSQIVRLDDPDLKPEGWDSLSKPRLSAFEDVAVYELHVRDFSIGDLTVPEEARGTFRAFATAGSNGRGHLEALARAGMTHLHLLPAFDFATVPEKRSDQQLPGVDLGQFPPDSDQPQRIIDEIKENDGFNWGYDPHHYTAPEGSYATDPDGPARIREFREMVQALNGLGLRVVLDVVYNHTHAAGVGERVVLDKIVPGYYHRLDQDGAVANSTCCANTASEHAMMEKLMLDSVLTWARDYKVDGFRFDLMGHHSKANMLKIREALDSLTEANDGVDGSKIYVYGEGWDFGEVAGNARFVNAAQANMAGTGIGTFNDRLRDGVRGGTPFSDPRDQGFVTGLHVDSNGTPQGDEKEKLLHSTDWIRLGLAGNLADFRLIDSKGRAVAGKEIDYLGAPAGYASDPQENVVYVSAHDNETLFDAIQMKASPATRLEQRVRMQMLAISITALAQGVPFFHAGVDMLRSKSMDRDSFNSGDWFNRLDFSYQDNNWGAGLPIAEKNREKWPLMKPLLADPSLKPSPRHIASTVEHLREMLKIRGSSQLFRLRTADQVKSMVHFLNTGPDQIPGLIVMSLGGSGKERIVVLFNARPEPVEFEVAELAGRELALHPVLRESADPLARQSSFDAATGVFTAPARTAAVFSLARPDADF